jgi:hypothetical protein
MTGTSRRINHIKLILVKIRNKKKTIKVLPRMMRTALKEAK